MAKNDQQGRPKKVAHVRQRKKTAPITKSEIVNAPLSAAKNEQQQNIETPTSEIKDMEVHYHPGIEHKNKPFKEYVMEGFMIFIAVMMGFIAENVREAIDNNEHVKQLTAQLVQDLKADTAQLNEIQLAETEIVRYNDSLVQVLQQPIQTVDTRQIQRLVANSHSLWLFHPEAGAIAAIKNELHLKQFSNSDIISYFSKYEKHIELLHTAQEINLQYQRSYLDPFLTQHLTPANMVAAFKNGTTPTAQMRNLSRADLDQLAADIVLIRIVSKEMVRDNKQLKADAVEMLKYVKKQYNVEE